MAKNKIIVLGLGKQGKAALYDIFHNCKNTQIIVADSHPEMTKHISQYPEDKVKAVRIDASNESELFSLIKDASIVIDALPGSFAFSVAKAAAEAGVNLVSSMYYINPLESESQKIQEISDQLDKINEVAKNKGITILPEFGLDPGIDLILGAEALSEFDTVEEFNSYGTGLPIANSAQNPIKYRFSWSVPGVMRAYKRPARIIRNGHDLEIDGKEIFSTENRHLLNIKEFDMPMECYPNGNSTYYAELFGLNSSIKTMGRYACRWPGHCDFWQTMVKSGFLNDDPIKVGSNQVSPIEFTTSLLNSQAQFHYGDSDKDIAMVRVDMSGSKNGNKKRIVYQLLDFRDMKTGFTAMQRTVGFTMGIGARLIFEGKISKKGVISPIDIPYKIIKQELSKYDMKIKRWKIPVE